MISVRIPEELIDRVKHLARMNGETLSTIVRAALETELQLLEASLKSTLERELEKLDGRKVDV